MVVKGLSLDLDWSKWAPWWQLGGVHAVQVDDKCELGLRPRIL